MHHPHGSRAWLLLVFLGLALSLSGHAAPAQEAGFSPDDFSSSPGQGNHEVIPLEVAIKVDQIIGINQKEENFSAVFSILMRYQDSRLAYQPQPGEPPFRMYHREPFLQLLARQKIPWPGFSVLNQQGRMDIGNEIIALSANGIVHYYRRATMTLQAPDFNFRSFPFDQQEFHIRLLSILPEDFYRFVALPDASRLGDTLGEEEWILYDARTTVTTNTSQTGLPSSEFVLSFSAHRHLMYYVVRLFVPMFIILMVSWFTFQLRDYVKRIDVGITNLLLFIAFNFTVSSELPKLGYVTFIDAVMTGAFVITGMVVLVNVSLRRMQTNGQEKRAAQLDRYAVWGYWPAYLIGTATAMFLL